MKKLIDKLAEKFYYKRFPERAHDHELAIMPIPIIKEERYKPIKLIVLEEIPEDINFSEDEIRDILSRQLAAKIADLMKLERVDTFSYSYPNLIGYRGTIKVLKEEA